MENVHRFLLLTIPVVFGVRCSSPPPGPNLRPTQITVLTPGADVQVSHRLEVEVGIFSELDTEGVGVAFRAFPQAQYDAHDPNTEGHVLGTSVQDVPAGGATFTVVLQVPYEIESGGTSLPFPPGDYYVVPEVDPWNTIEEEDETDQTGATAALHIRGEHRDHRRLMIEQAVMDVPAFELSWVFGAPRDPLGLTVLVRAEGGDPEVALRDAFVTACVRAPNTECLLLPVGIWDPATEAHVPRLVIPELMPGDPTSVHLDIELGPELADVFEGLLDQVAQSCLANVSACAGTYGVHLECAQDCLSDSDSLQACLLKCLPFTVEATVHPPAGETLFEPPGGIPGRTIAATLQLIAAPPPSPEVPSAVQISPDGEPLLDPCEDRPWYDPVSLKFFARVEGCADSLVWSVKVVPEQPPGGLHLYAGPGTIVGTDYGALYLAPACDSAAATTKVLVEATACGEADSTVVTLKGKSPSVKIEPPRISATVGSPGAAPFTAVMVDCPTPNPIVTWSLEVDAATLPRLVNGNRGSLTASAGPTTGYAAPPRLTLGPPVTVTLKAQACGVQGKATIDLGLATSLSFEKGYAKTFSNDLFGAGVDLYAGAFLDRAGGRAGARAIVPVKVFGKSFDLLRIVDDAAVDPRPPVASHFDHRIDFLGDTLSSLHCPSSDPICGGEPTRWSKIWCVPPDPPQFCLGDAYLQPCQRSSQCGSGLRCVFGTCTARCSSHADCDKGEAAMCPESRGISLHKKVIVVVVVPVTLEGRVCAEFGIEATLDLLHTSNKSFATTLGPFVEVGAYASAAAGYTGILAVGVRGELVLLREQFRGNASATIDLAGGYIQGSLREGVENVLQGGEGKVFLFADYPTLKWCGWYPCVGLAHKETTLVSWGSIFDVSNVCKWAPEPVTCATTADCEVCSSGVCRFSAAWPPAPVGPGPRACGDCKVDCVEGTCVDRLPGLFCFEQQAYVSAN